MDITQQYSASRGFTQDDRPYEQPVQWVTKNSPLIPAQSAAWMCNKTPDQLTRMAVNGELNRVIAEKGKSKQVFYYHCEVLNLC
jgi:hypothetical protein